MIAQWINEKLGNDLNQNSKQCEDILNEEPNFCEMVFTLYLKSLANPEFDLDGEMDNLIKECPKQVENYN